MFEQNQIEGVTVITLSNGKANVLDPDGYDALAEAAVELADARAVVLTAEGRIFSAGVDLRQLLEGGAGYAKRIVESMSHAYTALFDLPVPVVAAVNGHAIAGGAILAGVADHVLMSQGKIGLTELSVGVPFPPAPLEIMRHRLGRNLSHVVVGAGLYEAEQAKSIGLIDEVTTPEDLMARALAVANKLAEVPSAFALSKESMRQPARAMWDLDDDISTIVEEWSRPELFERIRQQLSA